MNPVMRCLSSQKGDISFSTVFVDAAPVLNSLKRSATSCCTWLIKKTKETMSKSKKKQEEYRGYRDTEREGEGVDGDGGGRGSRGNNMVSTYRLN